MFADFLSSIVVYPFMITLVRLSGLFITFPLFSDNLISLRIRVSLLFVFTLALAPAVSEFIPPAPESISVLVLIILKELFIGILLGIGARLFMLSINIAGDIMSAIMGLQAANSFDPQTNVNTTSLSRLLSIIGLLVFISLDLHLYIISAFIESYNLIEFATYYDQGELPLALISVASKIMILGVKMASPIVVTNLVVNISLGFLNRLVPQVQVFFISMPLTMLIGVFVLVLSISSMLILFAEEIEDNLIIFSQEINKEL